MRNMHGGEDVDFSDDTWGSGPSAGVIGSKRGGGNFGGPGGRNPGRSGGNFRGSGGNNRGPGGPGVFGNRRGPGDPGGFGNNRGPGFPGGFGNNRGPGGPGGFGNNRGPGGPGIFGNDRVCGGPPGGFGINRGPGGPGGFGNNRGPGGGNWDNGGNNGWRNGGGPAGNDYNRDRYSNAYGDYQGGYGPPRFGGPPTPLVEPVFRPMGRPGFQGGPVGPGGPGPMRPPNTIKFLTRCGVEMSIIKSWPKNVLRLCLPNHCGICSVDCENFSFARMHYTSKNHAKQIKKFMLDNHNINPNEDPLKSRDLYCELCDVHITSKVHGDSHYSGKSHRSIAEGKKPTKNPKLLQPGAQHRRERLIKREQKFLKQEPSIDQNADTQAVEIKKSEFFCEICKSSMSCSDQMTAHMNGKRHLTKEKQHILNMMKGQKEAKEKAAAEAAGNEKTVDAAASGGPATAAAAADPATATVAADPATATVAADPATATVAADPEIGDMADDLEMGDIADDPEIDDVADDPATADDDSWVDGTGEGWDNEIATRESEAPLLFSRRP